VILTGAGSSAYVGEIIADEINAAWPCQVRAISTTSLLTHPALYLEAAPTLLVSFARSGNSPESTAAVQLVRDLVPNARFLNITCNADGELARQGAGDKILQPADAGRQLRPRLRHDQQLHLHAAGRTVRARSGLPDGADRSWPNWANALAGWSAPVALGAQPMRV
jgi:hypothetical protein